MRIKLTVLSILLSISYIVLAENFDIPQGRYNFRSVSIYNLKHVIIFDSRSSKDKESIENLRRENYRCQNLALNKIRCQKFIKNIDEDITLPSKELKSLTPYFGAESVVSLITEADALSTYNVEQSVESERGSSFNYKLFVYQDGQKRLDVKFKNQAFRYSYITNENLTYLYKKRENLSKNEYKDYYYNIDFEQEE